MSDTLQHRSGLPAVDSEELGTLISRFATEVARRGGSSAVLELSATAAAIGDALGAHGRSPRLSEPLSPPTSDGAGLTPIRMTMHGIQEKRPGPRWQALYDAVWPGYRQWFVSEGLDARADLATCRAMLTSYMPELVPTWTRMTELAGGDDLTARMLALWQPPKFLPGCSQAVPPGDPTMLIRNYDYGPELFEQVCYSSQFADRRVIGTADCLWGLLDGMNDDGLAISLTFGGRPGSGRGFGVPLIVRYLLETAGSVAEAKRRLRTLPVAMSYNLTMTDAAGAYCTAYVGPGEPAQFTDERVATNHRGETPEYPERAQALRSPERRSTLTDLIRRSPSQDDLVEAFLSPPLASRDYSRAFGTLYTAVYRPADGSLEYIWPDDRWRRGFDSPSATKDVTLWGT